MRDNGLLEQVVWLVRSQGERRVLLSESGDLLGYACWHSQGLICGWPWSILGIYEQEHSPLVCTVRRRLAWGLPREVRDAEGELVGILHGRVILDRWMRTVVRIVSSRFVDLQGEMLGCWRTEKGQTRLEMSSAVQHDPFAKMLLLAALVSR